ncbi:MAG TPA: hypothetical protein VH143_28875 [Kofleriaceae bacterium]|jgi:hypothetical protein|nr:hypothetical protein [Kofleriaceae bacterium]
MTASLEAESAQLERILDELRDLVNPAAWQRVEQALTITTRLYGAGLGRALEHAVAAGADDATLCERIDADELLASLLVLHGLHPLPTDARVRRTAMALCEQLGCELEIVAVADGRLTLHARGELGGGAMSARVAENVIRRALEAAAPELTAIEIQGAQPAHDPSLVQLRVRREAS